MRINPQDTWHLATFTKKTPKEQLFFFFYKVIGDFAKKNFNFTDAPKHNVTEVE